jgi:predicted dithiol-disulfide oxidoreductase (DUF899 family)
VKSASDECTGRPSTSLKNATVAVYERGVEQLMGSYGFLDVAPLGRNEHDPAGWWRRHDEYEEAAPGATM